MPSKVSINPANASVYYMAQALSLGMTMAEALHTGVADLLDLVSANAVLQGYATEKSVVTEKQFLSDY